MKKQLFILMLFSSQICLGQSTLITPESNSGGMYSKRSQALNPFLTLPAYTLPDSGAGTRFMWIPERSAFRAGTVSGAAWNMANIGGFSFAAGFDNTAKGFMSSAFGAQNSANGNQSFAAGFNNTTSGNQSLVFGSFNTSEASSSIVLGSSNSVINTNTGNGTTVVLGTNNNAQSTNNYLIGQNNNGKNDLEFAFGFENAVSAFQSFSIGSYNDNSAPQSFNIGEANTTKIERAMNIGFNNKSNGIRALAIGNGNLPKGDQSIALGSGNRGEGVQSISMGNVSKSNSNQSLSAGLAIVNNSFGSVMLGMYNDSLTQNLAAKVPSKMEFVPEDPLFVVGNGNKETVRSNALTMYKNGKMGLSTNAPTEILDVNGSARFRNVVTDNNNTVFLTIETNGTIKKTTIGASDIRLKQNINPLENALKKVMQLSGVSYEFKESPDQKRMGFIAQEVETVFPEAVFTFDNDLKGVRYDDLIPVLLEALKEQQKQIEELSTKMLKLQNEIVELKSNSSQSK